MSPPPLHPCPRPIPLYFKLSRNVPCQTLGRFAFLAVGRLSNSAGSLDHCAGLEQSTRWQLPVRANVSDLIDRCDFFYFGTASADGRPYIRHRGESPAFSPGRDSVLTFVEEVGTANSLFRQSLWKRQRIPVRHRLCDPQQIRISNSEKIMADAALLPGN